MSSPVTHRVRFLAFAGVLFSSVSIAATTQALPQLNVDVAQTSISGISSGGFMAVQFQVAHSSIVKGAGIVAGGPFWCSQDDVMKATTLCSCTGEPTFKCQVTPTSAAVPALVTATRDMFAAKTIDDPANLARQRVLTVSGGKDPLVPKPIATQLSAYYTSFGLPSANLSEVALPDAGHTMPTPTFGIACGLTDEPYIGKCGFDSAQAILGWIYGALKPPTAGKARGKFIEFDQRPYIPNDSIFSFLWRSGLDSSGWVYVPDSCAGGAACRVHVALHGCKQGQSYLPLNPPPGGGLYYGTTFVKNTGYDRWADNNNVVVLFPQATSIPWVNPNGCWDWWGYTGGDYASKKGVQIRAIRAMVDRLATGARK